jgi:hypothetical protein
MLGHAFLALKMLRICSRIVKIVCCCECAVSVTVICLCVVHVLEKAASSKTPVNDPRFSTSALAVKMEFTYCHR